MCFHDECDGCQQHAHFTAYKHCRIIIMRENGSGYVLFAATRGNLVHSKI